MVIELNLLGALKDASNEEMPEIENYSIGWKIGTQLFESNKITFDDLDGKEVLISNTTFNATKIN